MCAHEGGKTALFVFLTLIYPKQEGDSWLFNKFEVMWMPAKNTSLSFKRLNLLLLISFLLIPGFFIAQEPDAPVQLHNLIFKIRDTDNNEMPGVIVNIYDKVNNKLLDSKTSGSTGNVDFHLQTFRDYMIDIVKKDYLTKKVWMNSQPPEAKRNYNLKYENTIVVKLYNKLVPEVGAELLGEPFEKYIYKQLPSKGIFVVDPEYSNALQNRLAQLDAKQRETLFNEKIHGIKPGANPKSTPSTVVANAPNTIVPSTNTTANKTSPVSQTDKTLAYNNLLTDGEKLFKDKSYILSKEKYAEAVKIYGGLKTKPKENIAKNQLDKINGMIEKDQNLKKEQEKIFTAAVKSGTESMGQKDFKNAKAAFTEASYLKSDEKVKKQLAEATKLLNQQLKELDERFAKAIASADEALGKKQMTKAKADYTEALSIKPEEQYPKDKIAEIDLYLKKQDDAKEDKFKKEIAQGDKAFENKNYADARSAFITAAKLKPAEKYPKVKIKEIDKLLAELQSTLDDISSLQPKDRNEIAGSYIANHFNDLKQAQLEKIQQLKLVRAAYLKTMENNATKYSTENQMTKLLDIVDGIQK